MKDTIWTKVGENGRINIPAIFRNNLEISAGDDIILHLQENAIYITTPDQSLHKLQAKVKDRINAIGQNISLVDELLTTRRLETEHE